MIRRMMAVSSMAALALGGTIVAAAPAAADVERCSGPRSVIQGVTTYSCMKVTVPDARAYTRVYYNLTSTATVRICDQIILDGRGTTPRCDDFPVGPGNSRFDTLGSYLVNPAGTQLWVSQSTAGASAPVRSPNVYDT